MTALSQNKTDIYEYIDDHGSIRQNIGTILAIMTDDAYIPIQIKEGVCYSGKSAVQYTNTIG